ncbi:MAG: T9SS type A sorting domain-containing protein [Flavobacteriaceae bacterium]|nr:T9SS type A sorting domain-containing protein [Flavobacteriaceae bacterium]
MKKNYIILSLLIVSQTIKAQTINIPDVNFKNALLYTLSVDTTGDGVFNSSIDTNSDNKIQVSEAEAALGLDVGVFNISSLEGISYFKNIEILYCDYNKLTSLDISKNTKLKYLECTVNQLTSLDISKNTSIEELYFPSNGLTSIDVSKHPNLKILECAYNELTSLDVSQNPKLTSLLTYRNKLTSLNLKNGNNTILTSFSVKYNSDLTCIKVDDVDSAMNNSSWIKDSTASYSESCGVLGTDDFENGLQIICYPNPVKNILRIKTSNAIEINSIKVYNTLGNLVIVEKSHFKQLDLTNLSQGVFFVVIKTANNSFTKRIVKE